jgi:predicted house-cleaning noncanonical NTP pyrophosphatase (MazG superfamily)
MEIDALNELHKAQKVIEGFNKILSEDARNIVRNAVNPVKGPQTSTTLEPREGKKRKERSPSKKSTSPSPTKVGNLSGRNGQIWCPWCGDTLSNAKGKLKDNYDHILLTCSKLKTVQSLIGTPMEVSNEILQYESKDKLKCAIQHNQLQGIKVTIIFLVTILSSIINNPLKSIITNNQYFL